MSKLVRSAQGELVDFELLAIKQQLAAAPVPKAVEERKKVIVVNDGEKTQEEETTLLTPKNKAEQGGQLERK